MSLLMSLLSGLSGPASKWIGYGSLVAAAGLFGYVGLTMYGNNIRANADAQETITTLNAQIADDQHSLAAMSALYHAEAARAADTAAIKGNVHAAHVTTGCAVSPAIGAAFDGLRGAGSASGRPHKNPH